MEPRTWLDTQHTIADVDEEDVGVVLSAKDKTEALVTIVSVSIFYTCEVHLRNKQKWSGVIDEAKIAPKSALEYLANMI